MDPERQKRLNEIACIAVRIEAECGVPALSTVAQWAVESRWGAEPCGLNHFGIKRAKRHEKFILKTTREWYTEKQIAAWDKRHPSRPARKTGKTDGPRFEVSLDDEFADYGSLEESARDYAWLVSRGTPYAEAWERYQKDRDVRAFVAGIAGSYSSSSKYSFLVNTIAGQGNVRAAIAAARGEA
jgi:flagellum-specific peptidoglycan hydrolase FlgJ